MQVTVEIFKKAYGEYDLLDAVNGCLVVLTFKNTCKKKVEFEARKAKCIEELSQLKGVKQVEEMHLFANTRLETTVVFQVLQ